MCARFGCAIIQAILTSHYEIVDHEEIVAIFVLEFHELAVKIERVQDGGDTYERRPIELQEGDDNFIKYRSVL